MKLKTADLVRPHRLGSSRPSPLAAPADDGRRPTPAGRVQGRSNCSARAPTRCSSASTTRRSSLLEKAAAEDKTKTSYRVHLARAYRYAGRDKQAAAVLEDVLKANPDHVEAGQFLAELYAQQEDWKRVVEVLEPLLKYRHDYPTYHLLAEAKYNLTTSPPPAATSRRPSASTRKARPTDYDLGNIYLAGNFFALAAESYHAALSLGMQSPVLHYKLGVGLLQPAQLLRPGHGGDGQERQAGHHQRGVVSDRAGARPPGPVPRGGQRVRRLPGGQGHRRRHRRPPRHPLPPGQHLPQRRAVPAGERACSRKSSRGCPRRTRRCSTSTTPSPPSAPATTTSTSST